MPGYREAGYKGLGTRYRRVGYRGQGTGEAWYKGQSTEGRRDTGGRVQGTGYRRQVGYSGAQYRQQVARYRVEWTGYRGQAGYRGKAGCKGRQEAGYKVQEARYRLQGAGYRVQGQDTWYMVYWVGYRE